MAIWSYAPAIPTSEAAKTKSARMTVVFLILVFLLSKFIISKERFNLPLYILAPPSISSGKRSRF